MTATINHTLMHLVLSALVTFKWMYLGMKEQQLTTDPRLLTAYCDLMLPFEHAEK